jgi:hypothetical protein
MEERKNEYLGYDKPYELINEIKPAGPTVTLPCTKPSLEPLTETVIRQTKPIMKQRIFTFRLNEYRIKNLEKDASELGFSLSEFVSELISSTFYFDYSFLKNSVKKRKTKVKRR